MASTVPKLPEERVNRNPKQRGEWQSAPGVGWQHGSIPQPPPRLLKPSRDAWMTWMQAWFASHWSLDDLPGLRHTVQLYDAVQRGELRAAPELRQMMDSYGITFKGQQDRRWLRPKPQEQVPGIHQVLDIPSPYAGLDLTTGKAN